MSNVHQPLPPTAKETSSPNPLGKLTPGQEGRVLSDAWPNTSVPCRGEAVSTAPDIAEGQNQGHRVNQQHAVKT